MTALLALTLVGGLAQLPASGAPAGDRVLGLEELQDIVTIGDPVEALADYDVRGKVAPLATQLDAAATLGVGEIRWNRFGTPASLLPRRDGSLGPAPGDAVAGARSWLRDHAAVFGLSAAQVDDLALVNNQELAASDARSVLFRQEFGGLPAATGGQVSVGVDAGQVFYVSSSIVRAAGELPAATLTPLQAWRQAAADVGKAVSDVDASDVASAVSGGWTRLVVPGLAQQQLVRARSLPMSDGSVRRVFEVNVIDVAGGSADAYTVLVDAVSGTPLVRRSAVDNAEYTDTFTGTVTATECGVKHPFTLTDDATRQINAVAIGAPSDDFVVEIYDPAGGLLVKGDLLTNPEVATYSADAIPGGVYSARVCPFDAASIVVGQYSLTVNATNVAAPDPGTGLPTPRWRYFLANPTLDDPTQTPTNSVVGCWRLETGCDNPPSALDHPRSLGPWDSQGAIPTFTTIGNNANTHEAWASPLTPGGTAQAPYSPTREYTTEFTDAWNNSKCDPAQLTPGGNDINAAVTGLFASHNRMHDYSYYLGFTEANYNLQSDNAGRGGVGGDPEIGNAQAGALTGGSAGMYLGRDNANQITLQDGTPGITNQYLFQPIAGAFYAPCTDGGLDMGIVGHEYTHAISNRMIGGPDDGILSEQGGAMGEAWGDLVAGEYQFSHGYDNGGNIWAVGAYATGNLETAIRDYAINDNPLNYSNYGFDTTGPEVHADGEIWNGTQWEVRQALVDAYDAQFPYADKALQRDCAQATPENTPRRVETCPGNRRWVQLMFDAFLLQQGATSMLDARDAMLAADQARFGGADLATMWAAFARRGMGRDAVTPDADSDEPTPSFASPLGANSAVSFRSSGPTQVFVGDYEARVTPIADTDPGTPLTEAAPFTAGTYRMLAVAPDRGFTRFTLVVPAGGGAVEVNIDNAVNVASSAAGATVIGSTDGSLNAAALIDGTEATNWGGVTTDSVDVSHPQVSVDLAGDVSTVRRVNVSAYLRPAPASSTDVPLYGEASADEDPDSGSRFTALRQFALEACVASCGAADAVWSRFYTSPEDAFPSVRPRPVAPTLNMREFDVPDTDAAAVRLVVLENQCSGHEGYAGELDNDPTNNTDCKADSDRDSFVHAAELQVFGTATTVTSPTPGVIPAPSLPTPTPTPTSTPTPITAPTPTTPGAQRVPTGVQLRVFRAVQTKANAAPRLRIRLTVDGARAARPGRLVVKLDGRRYRLVKVNGTKSVQRLLLTRRLAPGKHRVRVYFRPADRAAFAPSKSKKVKIRVLRR